MKTNKSKERSFINIAILNSTNRIPVLIFSSIFLLSVLSGYVAIKQNLETENTYQDLELKNVKDAITLSKAQKALSELHIIESSYILGSQQSREKTKNEFARWPDQFQSNIKSYSKQISLPNEQVLYQNFERSLSDYLKHLSVLFKLIDEKKIEMASDYQIKVTNPDSNHAITTLDNLIAFQYEEASTRAKEFTFKVKESRKYIFIYVILKIFLFISLLKTLSDFYKKMQSSYVTSLHNSKMASVGEMTGSIAHEINNPLTILYGASHRLQELIKKEDLNLELANKQILKIIDMTNRIDKIVKGMKSISRNSESDPLDPVKLHLLIMNVKSLSKERFKTGKIKFEIGEVPDLTINCRLSQIEQVLINLLNNSYDAIIDFPNKWVRIHFKEQNDKLLIIVTDCGGGIPANIAEKLMTPFFTTKEVGKGTGLGLSISGKIIEEHEGRMYYNSESQNTSFIIELPIRK